MTVRHPPHLKKGAPILSAAAASLVGISAASAAPSYVGQARFAEARLTNGGPTDRVEAPDFGAFDAVAGPVQRDEPPGPPLGGDGEASVRQQSTLGPAGVQARLSGSARLGEGRQFTPSFDAVVEAVVSTTFTLDAPHHYSLRPFEGTFASQPLGPFTTSPVEVGDARYSGAGQTQIGDVTYTAALSGPGVSVSATPLFTAAGDFFRYDPLNGGDLPDGRPADFDGTLGPGTYTLDLRLLADEGVGVFEFDLPASLTLTAVDGGGPAVVPLPAAAPVGLAMLAAIGVAGWSRTRRPAKA